MRRGFTLLEVMVSSVLLIVGITGILQGFSTASAQATRDRQMTTAIHVAEGVAEAILAFQQSDPDLSAGSHADKMQFDRSGHRVSSGGEYIASCNVEPNTPIDNIRRINITVRWPQANRGEVSLMVHRR
jgi:prepilin-type N-terminal cleavage/methylation domain-containing protein